MVNITKPPKINVCNNYNTIAKETQEHQNLFPKVEPIDFSTYKQRTSSVNYDITEVARRTQLQLEANQNAQDDENGQKFIDDSRGQAIKFQSLLKGRTTNAKQHSKGVRFGFSISDSGQDDAPKEFIDYHIDDEEDKERLRARRLLFTTVRGARDSLAMIRPKFNIPEPVKFKKLIPEPKPISAIDILVEQLARIHLPFQPPVSNLKYIEGQSDVIVTVRKSFHIQDTERILCHSQILSKSSNSFKELFDLHVWDMELQEKRDIHCATTTDEGVWRVIDRVIPVYIPCHVHLEETTRPPPVIKKKLSIDTADPYCSRHEIFEDWIDPKKEDRKCEELERASDYEPEENPFYKDYCMLVDEELNVDAEEFVRKQSVQNLPVIENVKENIDVVASPAPPTVEGEDQEVNFAEELANLPKNMELVKRRRIEANALLMTCKPFLYNLATSETKETLSDQMLDNLQKFVTLADMYFVLTNPEENDDKKKSVKFEDDVRSDKLKSIILEGKLLRESFRNSLSIKQSVNEGIKKEDSTLVQNVTQGSFRNESLARNSKTGSIVRVSQMKRPSEVFAELKAKRKASLLRRKKSVIRKILYPIEETPLIEPEAHLLEIEQQLDLCLLPPMAWQLEAKGGEEEIKEENVESKGENIHIEGENANVIKQVDEESKEFEESQIEGDVDVTEEDEEDEEPEEEVCKREHQHDIVQNVKLEAPKVYKIIKGEWTCAIFYPMLEYFYTERCHVPCEDVAALWKASAQILLQSLTDIIILHPISEYCHLALKTETNRKSLLKLATNSYKSEIGSHMKKLKHFCELFEYGGAKDSLPYTFRLFTAFMVDRKNEVVEEGFHEFADLNICILKVYDGKEKLFAENANGLEFLTFEKRLQDQTQHFQHVREHWHGRKVDEPFLNNNRQKQWSVTTFGPFIVDECYKFYKHLVGQTFRMKEPETISLHMPIPFLKQPVLHKALQKAFPKDKLCIESDRGMSYYIGGETRGNSLTVTGHPLLILEAMKCIPRDMVARMALQFRAPTEKTFLKVFSVTRTIGIDIEKDQIFLLKNYKKLKLALEYFLELSGNAFIPLDVPREFTELVVPSNPF